MAQRIYRHPKHPTVDLPALDLLSLLFDSELSVAQDATILLQEAADPTNTINKAQTRELTERIAHGLRHQYGVGSGGPNKDVVTVMSYGQILVPAAFYGVIAAGGVYSAASPSSTVSELARQISTADSKLVICSIEHVDVVTKAAVECGLPLSQVLVLQSSPAWTFRSLEGDVDVLSRDRLPWEKITDPQLLKNSLITILWSSGTTGLPKGVMLSHTNLVAETYITAMSSREWVEKEVANGTHAASEYRALAHLPISHIAGLFGYIIAPIYSGGTVIWMNRYRWEDMLKYLRQYKITAFYTVPSIWLRISKAKEVTDHFKYVEAAATGAAPMDDQLQSSASSLLGNKSGELSIGQTWGLSETTGAVTAVPKGEQDVSGSIGSILPSVEIRMVDDDCNDVQEGQEGEMILRTPLVTNGYYRNEKATKDAFHNGWFCTGDIGVRRGGRFFIVDRKKELLKYKGLQVAPAEIENLLISHEQIREAAVIGVPAPDDRTTDLPRAYIVAVEGSGLTEGTVKNFIKDRLAPYKQLRGGVVFIDEIPKSAIGKILRRELRDRARQETQPKAKL
ncbi:hypothetical protein LTR95_017838 [Oleoguttula sp. CCFEE 5521]